MDESDLANLPAQTCKFVMRLFDLGLDRTRIHGLFVMLGLYAGAPNTQEEIESIFSRLNHVVPIDRTKNIDQVVGHLYDGYDQIINEFCYRSGAEFKFREVKVPDVEETFSIVYLKDEGRLECGVATIDKLADASRLYDSFLLALGRSSEKRGASLLEAFSCGIFQIQLHAQIDVHGARQISEVIGTYLPLFYSRCFKTLADNRIEYFLGLGSGQIALLDLMQSMHSEYAQQMWGFQSCLFFYDGKMIDGVNDLSASAWHSWVVDRAQQFSIAYPEQLVPFSQSNITLSDLPKWGGGVEIFDICDRYIDEVWGYAGGYISGRVEMLEYRALMVHLVYSSLTSSRDS